MTNRDREFAAGIVSLAIGLVLAVPEVFTIHPYLPRFYVGSVFAVIGLVMIWGS